MNLFRSSIRPSVIPRSYLYSSFLVCRTQINPQRTIVYMDGLTKDDRITIAPVRTEYAARLDQTYTEVEDAWRRLTGEHAAAFELPRELLLQVFTHKSFRHGIFPYNERLAFYGRKLFTLQIALLVSAAPSESLTAIAGKDIDAVTAPTADHLLHSRNPIFNVAKASQILPLIKWKSAKNFEDVLTAPPRKSGLFEAGSQTIFASIGAVAMHHGGAKAEQFVRRVVMGGPYGILKVSVTS
ncbi:mitochondrial 54S ribosomal protein mL57 [Limtongia smithiae]|uniref:mitochondrial 54S ribosomal protein mL57 n=1 Tax=Limtongia smithiae TaxID=1125753 RepID=UPI0034CEE5C6